MNADGPGGAGSRDRARRAPARGAPPLRKLLLAPLCGIGAFLLVVVLFHRPYEPPGGHGALDDINSIKGIAGLLLQEGSPLAADGRLDVYGVLERSGSEAEEVVRHCTSMRFGKGPTAAEIAARDYANFPWQRRKGPFDPAADPPVPILWEREPRKGPNGSTRLVAYSDSSAQFHFDDDDAALREFFRRNPGQE